MRAYTIFEMDLINEAVRGTNTNRAFGNREKQTREEKMKGFRRKSASKYPSNGNSCHKIWLISSLSGGTSPDDVWVSWLSFRATTFISWLFSWESTPWLFENKSWVGSSWSSVPCPFWTPAWLDLVNQAISKRLNGPRVGGKLEIPGPLRVEYARTEPILSRLLHWICFPGWHEYDVFWRLSALFLMKVEAWCWFQMPNALLLFRSWNDQLRTDLWIVLNLGVLNRYCSELSSKLFLMQMQKPLFMTILTLT